MYLTHIRAKNFLSFRELEYNFNTGLPTLLLGENLTDPGQQSNGSGKSALAAVIEYCALHLTSKKATDINLIFWGEKEGETELGIHCPIRKETLLIQRKITLKGGSSQLSINGIVKYAFDDKMVNEIDRDIIEWIGINKEDLQNFYILSKFKYTSFFAASNTNLTQLIGRFSNSSIIEGIDKDILKQVDALEASRNELLDQRNRLYGRIEAHNATINYELTVDKKQLVATRLSEIDDQIIELAGEVVHWKTKISQTNEAIEAAEDRLLEKLTKLQNANTELQALTTRKNDFEERFHNIDVEAFDVKQERNGVELTLKKYNDDYHDMSLVLQEIDRNIRGSVTCPKCSHQFLIGKADVVIEDEKVAMTQTEAVLLQLRESIDLIKVNIELFNPKLLTLERNRTAVEAEEREFRTLKRNLGNAVDLIEREKGAIETEIVGWNNSIKNFNLSIDSINKRSEDLNQLKTTITVDSFDNTARITAAKEEIANCEKELLDIESSDKSLGDEVFTVKQWAFTFKEFTQYLSVKTLKILQGYANHFLENIKSDLRITLEGYKLKADGTLSDKITAYIIRDGETREFGNFSGGERVRLECAMILTIQHAINSTHKFGGLDFLGIDEIFESSDSKGIEVLTTSLMDLGKTILLTTHVPGSQYDCPILKVVKENRISRIII